MAISDEDWKQLGQSLENQYNIIMNELFGIKWQDTVWFSKRLLVVFILFLFYGICSRIFKGWDYLMYPE